MRRTITAFVLMMLLPTLPAAADDCGHSRPLDAVLQVDGATTIEIVAEAGWLRVDGQPGATEVKVEGRACASSEGLLDEIELITRRDGDRLLIEARVADHNTRWRSYARLDLTIEVPADLPLEIEDGSGETRIRNVAAIDLVDGSGGIEISGVSGSVSVRDGSGEIEVDRVGGDVDINDNSGSLWIRDVESNVFLEDGSGEIEIAGVRGDVEIDEDGSGGISIRDVTGHVTVGSDGSGSIRVESVGGDFTVRRDGSGAISVVDVRGTVRTP